MNASLSRIAIGDRVALNSGGPAMLVVDFEWGRAICAYPLNGKIEEVGFRDICLTKVEYRQNT